MFDAKIQGIKCRGVLPQDLGRRVLLYDNAKEDEEASVSLLKSHLLCLNSQLYSDYMGIVCFSEPLLKWMEVCIIIFKFLNSH